MFLGNWCTCSFPLQTLIPDLFCSQVLENGTGPQFTFHLTLHTQLKPWETREKEAQFVTMVCMHDYESETDRLFQAGWILNQFMLSGSLKDSTVRTAVSPGQYFTFNILWQKCLCSFLFCSLDTVVRRLSLWALHFDRPSPLSP